MQLSAPAYADNILSITVSKNNYSFNDAVELEIRNVSTDTVEFWGVNIEKAVSGKWKIVRPNVGCPCAAKCKRALLVLKQQMIHKLSWDLRDNRCRRLEAGEYKATISNYDPVLEKYVSLGESTVFKVE